MSDIVGGGQIPSFTTNKATNDTMGSQNEMSGHLVEMQEGSQIAKGLSKTK